MELTVLGAGGTWPAPGGATSGYLLRHEGYHLWIDAGTGTLARLQQHVALAEIDAVLISHGHPDHFVDLYPCFYARYYARQGATHLPLFCPTDFFGHFAELVSRDTRDVVGDAYDVRELSPGSTFEAGPFRVTAHEMAHVGVAALGFRLECDGSVLAYTGDTGPSDEVVKMATDADLLVSEATWQDGMELLPFHLSARQAGEHASRAGSRRLLLTHMWPSNDRSSSLEQAQETFRGDVELASEDLRIIVAP